MRAQLFVIFLCSTCTPPFLSLYQRRLFYESRNGTSVCFASEDTVLVFDKYVSTIFIHCLVHMICSISLWISVVYCVSLELLVLFWEVQCHTDANLMPIWYMKNLMKYVKTCKKAQEVPVFTVFLSYPSDLLCFLTSLVGSSLSPS